MSYTIGRLAAMAGVTIRALRHYEQIGLLLPESVSGSGYRLYGQKQVEELQQILFYRALGAQLKTIKDIIHAPEFEQTKALERHLDALLGKRRQLDVLIQNVRKSISSAKGETHMTDEERFEGLKAKLIADNERQYGREARERYGDAVDASNEKLKSMTQQQFSHMQSLEKKVGDALTLALATKDPAGEMAQQACELHRQWLACSWPRYSKEAHLGLAQTYIDDSRFGAYYEKYGEGCAHFLYDALRIYCGELK